ncbi:hypothetical protein BGW37DRAFT_485043 [Umbelopsis sp. PMI_123]|nr:hypothetical protein BGW37DRAFT_485043 [Umbelopsis sp. PMI_123]
MFDYLSRILNIYSHIRRIYSPVQERVISHAKSFEYTDLLRVHSEKLATVTTLKPKYPRDSYDASGYLHPPRDKWHDYPRKFDVEEELLQLIGMDSNEKDPEKFVVYSANAKILSTLEYEDYEKLSIMEKKAITFTIATDISNTPIWESPNEIKAIDNAETWAKLVSRWNEVKPDKCKLCGETDDPNICHNTVVLTFAKEITRCHYCAVYNSANFLPECLSTREAVVYADKSGYLLLYYIIVALLIIPTLVSFAKDTQSLASMNIDYTSLLSLELLVAIGIAALIKAVQPGMESWYDFWLGRAKTDNIAEADYTFRSVNEILWACIRAALDADFSCKRLSSHDTCYTLADQVEGLLLPRIFTGIDFGNLGCPVYTNSTMSRLWIAVSSRPTDVFGLQVIDQFKNGYYFGQDFIHFDTLASYLSDNVWILPSPCIVAGPTTTPPQTEKPSTNGGTNASGNSK